MGFKRRRHVLAHSCSPDSLTPRHLFDDAADNPEGAIGGTQLHHLLPLQLNRTHLEPVRTTLDISLQANTATTVQTAMPRKRIVMNGKPQS